MLREYQQQGRYQVNACMNAGRHPLLVMPTGTGKTKTAVEITRDRINLGQRIYVLTPQQEIFQQWLKEYNEAGIDAGYINSEGFMGRNRKVYVCMPISLINIMNMIPEAMHPNEIITDECHHSAANTYDMIYDYFGEAIRLGLTATPYRYDNKSLNKYYTDIVQTIDMQEAISTKQLAKPLIIVPEEYKMKIPIKNGDFDPAKQAEMLGKQKIIGDIIENYGIIFQGFPVLVACCTFEHARCITEKFREVGWNFEHIHSKLQDYERTKMIRKIKNGKLNGLCTVGIGIEGIDIPGLYGLIWMRRTLSLTVYLQFTGRVLRPYSKKEYGIIIDGVGNTVIHGRPEMARTWSLESDYVPEDPEYSAPQMKVCPVCGVMNNIDNITCHICGMLFDSEEAKKTKKRKFPTMIDGRLVVLEDKEQHEEISKRLQQQRKENFEKMEKEKIKEVKLKKITKKEKLDIIQKNLTGKKTNGIFRDTVWNFL